MLGISPLRHHQVDRAYPLMQAAMPQLTLEQWRRFADRHGSTSPFGAHGIMVGTAPNGMLRAAFVYEVNDLRSPGAELAGRRLIVRHLVLPTLGRDLAIAPLIRTMAQLARAHHCTRTLVHLPVDANWQIDSFRGHGFEIVAAVPGALPPSFG